MGSHRRPEFLSSACQLPLPIWLENRPYKVWVALNPWIIIDAAVPAARTSSSISWVHLEPADGTSSSLVWGSSRACCRDQFIPLLGFIWSLLSGPVHPSSGVHLSGAGQEAGALSSVPVLHHCNPSWLESRPYKGEFGVSSPY